jgi:hypothetical protein
MRIERFMSIAFASDGGTILCEVLLEDGSATYLGMDGRIPKRKSERVIFMGAGYGTQPGARIFARGSAEESAIIAAVEDVLKRGSRLEDFEALAKSDYGSLSESERSDWRAAVFLQALRDRGDPPPPNPWLP